MSNALNVHTKFVDEGIEKVREDLVKLEGIVRTEQEASVQKKAEHLEHCKSLLSQRNYSSLEQTQSAFQTNLAQQEEQRLAEYEVKIKEAIEQLAQKFSEVKEAFDKMNKHKEGVRNLQKNVVRSQNSYSNSVIDEIRIEFQSVFIVGEENDEELEHAQSFASVQLNELKNEAEHENNEHFAQLDAKNNEGMFAENEKLQHDYKYYEVKRELEQNKSLADKLGTMLKEKREHIAQLKVIFGIIFSLFFKIKLNFIFYLRNLSMNK